MKANRDLVVSSSLPSNPLQVARDRLGRWIVQDPTGMKGGVFLKRNDALRFATGYFGVARMAVLAPAPIEIGSVEGIGERRSQSKRRR